MNRVIVFLSAAAFMFVACRKEAPPAATATQTQTVTTTSAAPPKDLSGETVDLKIPVDKFNVVTDCRAGSTLDPLGSVSTANSTFTTKEKIHMTMFLREAPNELVVRVRALDPNEKEVSVTQKPAEGVKSATLTLGPLKKGKYTLEGMWGGNVVCDEEIEVK